MFIILIQFIVFFTIFICSEQKSNTVCRKIRSQMSETATAVDEPDGTLVIEFV